MADNPITEEVKKVAEETGAQVENVAEGTISKEKQESVEKALAFGASLVLHAIKKEGIELTDEQEKNLTHVYEISFAVSSLLTMK